MVGELFPILENSYLTQLNLHNVGRLLAHFRVHLTNLLIKQPLLFA
ncbi:hypothetical protein COO91_10605 (plasmid) [Nostoc flagelliforme CCNUN1]|uniref:Uncharacterized protein n=1 Tax=Nostoc flagelliforme CCNUN1 TaxID=2038116 RepID=A0A2K8T9N4_9NOSO|nr:hypothetical protein COO91_10605 [Nostoc flagelliforme CCNUN1]